jgi:hypothetical protein
MKLIVLFGGLALFIAAQAKIVERFNAVASIIEQPQLAASLPDIHSAWD